MRVIPSSRITFLQELREKILPWAQSPGDGDALLLQVPDITLLPAKITRRDAPPLSKTHRGNSHISAAHWPQEGLNSFNIPYIGFILEGEADLEIGTRQTKRNESDRYIVTLARNSFFIIPPGVPHPDGKKPHWLRPHHEQAYSHIFWIHILPSGAFCHTCTSSHGYHTSTHNLFIKDPYLTTLTDMLMEELSHRQTAISAVTQSLLLTLFRRVERELAHQTSFFIDPHDVQNLGKQGAKTSLSTSQSTERACGYIRTHLNEPLTLSLIARHAYVSVSQLKRIFQAKREMPVMQYVTYCRIETAKSLLADTTLPIGEISCMVGYKHPEQFSRLFLKHSGFSPREYRKKYN